MPEAPMPDLAVVCNHLPSRDHAATLARQLQCPLLVGVDVAQLPGPDFVVLCDADGLGVQQTGPGAPGPVRAEFAAGSVEHRRRFGGGKGQMIAKAIGVKAGVYPRVLDLTAGLGKDGFVLASLGCRVTLVERSLLVYQLLKDGLARAQDQARDPELVATLERIDLIHGDSCDYLNNLTPDQSPEVVYLDPMFPEREKSAQVKKEMRAFHQLVGRDEDAADLLEAALARCIYRVVVKRPRKAPFLGGQAPSYQLTGKSSRFDIYALKKLPGKTG